ncbi:MAG: radical SAM protein [Clostridia bacterium]|nr:radical SAM protein [Clostridia bacterium]
MAVKHKTIPIFVPHWGCPCDCLFCDQKKITGLREEMTPERAALIIEEGISRKQPGDVLEIGFFGGSFTGIPAPKQEALLSLAHKAKLAGKVDGIRLSTRPDYINETVLKRLLSFGVTTVELGAQSMDDDVLAFNRRGHSAEQTKRAAQAIRESGIGLGLQMMIGLPGDSFEKAMMTAEEFAKLSPDCVRIYPTLVIRDTGLDELYKNGQYTPLSVEEAVWQCSRLYRFYTERNIEVIRMGLLDMKTEDLVAGPFHPAFGELVLSEVCYNSICMKMASITSDKVSVRVHPRFVSVLCGQKRRNIIRLQEEFGLHKIDIIQDESVPDMEFILNGI